MTQFQAPAPIDTVQGQYGQPLKLSGLAITALICSLIFFCPLTTLIGVILGLVGFFTIGPEKGTKGKGMALIAVVIGVIATSGTGYLSYKGFRFFREAMVFMMQAPQEALTKGYAGDYKGFRESFYGPGATDPSAEAFINELRSRYGEFQSCRMNGKQNNTPTGQPTVVMPQSMVFDAGTINGEAEYIIADQVSGKIIMKLGYIKIIDPDKGDLKYPPDSSGASTSPGDESGKGENESAGNESGESGNIGG